MKTALHCALFALIFGTTLPHPTNWKNLSLGFVAGVAFNLCASHEINKRWFSEWHGLSNSKTLCGSWTAAISCFAISAAGIGSRNILKKYKRTPMADKPTYHQLLKKINAGLYSNEAHGFVLGSLITGCYMMGEHIRRGGSKKIIMHVTIPANNEKQQSQTRGNTHEK